MPASAVFPVVAEYKSFTPWGVYLWLELTFTTQTDDASTRSTEAWVVLRTCIIDSPAIRRNGRIHAVRNVKNLLSFEPRSLSSRWLKPQIYTVALQGVKLLFSATKEKAA